MPGKIQNPIRSLGVLTGGGDVPGLNAAIKALTYRAETMNIRIIGLRAGWEGITYLDRSRKRDALIFRAEEPETWQGSYLMPLTRLNTRNIEVLPRTSSDNLCEARDTDSHQFSSRPLLSLLAA